MENNNITPIFWDNGYNLFTKKKSPSHFIPHSHQSEIWPKMSEHFLEFDRVGGIIWVPTGGGKTTIAANWVLKNYLLKGHKVVWFAHRITLLIQAAETFQQLINENSDFSNKDISISSSIIAGSKIDNNSKATKWNQISPNVQLIFSTIQSARNKESQISRVIKNERNPPFVVIDECHHAQAPTYFKVLNYIKNDCKAKLLGLSATPYCSSESDTNRLLRLFGQLKEKKSEESVYIDQITRRKLIDEEILKDCDIDKPKTYINFRQFLDNSDDMSSITDEFGEIKNSIKKSMAQNGQRNKLIFQYYKDNQERFEKTIIFTPNILGNQLLYREFYNGEIYADYIDSTRDPVENLRILNDFKTNPNFKVLINVDIATEGYDAPHTKTVFITRPTKSPGLIQQMIGRAFRGYKAGGIHDKGYIVSFCDDWEGKYDDILIEDVIKSEEIEIIPTNPDLSRIAADIIRHVEITQMFYPSLETVINHFPTGYFKLYSFSNDENDIEPKITFIPIYSNFDNFFPKFDKNYNNALGSEPQITANIFQSLPEPHLSMSEIDTINNIFSDDSLNPSELFESTKEVHDIVQKAIIKHDSQLNEDETNLLKIIYRHPSERMNDKELLQNEKCINLSIKVFQRNLKNRNNLHELLQPVKLSTENIDLKELCKSIEKANPDFTPTVNLSSFKIMEIPKEIAQKSHYWGFVSYSNQTILFSEYLVSIHVPRIVLEYVIYHLSIHFHLRTLSDLEIANFEYFFKPSNKGEKSFSQNYVDFKNIHGSTPIFSLHHGNLEDFYKNDYIEFCNKFLCMYEFILKENRDIDLPANSYLKL